MIFWAEMLLGCISLTDMRKRRMGSVDSAELESGSYERDVKCMQR